MANPYTIARVAPQQANVSALGGGDGAPPTQLTIRFPVLVTRDEAIRMRDGWVAIARVSPYRVEFRSPDGGWTGGAPLSFSAVATQSADSGSIPLVEVQVDVPDHEAVAMLESLHRSRRGLATT